MTINEIIVIIDKIKILAKNRDWRLKDETRFCLFGAGPLRLIIARSNSVKYCDEFLKNYNTYYNYDNRLDVRKTLDQKLIDTIRDFIPEANEVEFHLYSCSDAADKSTCKVKETLNIIPPRIS